VKVKNEKWKKRRNRNGKLKDPLGNRGAGHREVERTEDRVTKHRNRLNFKICELGSKDILETELIRINKDLWAKLQKAIADYDFGINDLVDWVLRDVDLDEYAKKLAREVEFELEASKEAKREDEREAEEEAS